MGIDYGYIKQSGGNGSWTKYKNRWQQRTIVQKVFIQKEGVVWKDDIDDGVELIRNRMPSVRVYVYVCVGN